MKRALFSSVFAFAKKRTYNRFRHERIRVSTFASLDAFTYASYLPLRLLNLRPLNVSRTVIHDLPNVT